MQTFFQDHSAQRKISASVQIYNNDAVLGHLGFIAGVVTTARIPAFEKMLWRISHGNIFFKQAQIDEPLKDPITVRSIFEWSSFLCSISLCIYIFVSWQLSPFLNELFRIFCVPFCYVSTFCYHHGKVHFWMKFFEFFVFHFFMYLRIPDSFRRGNNGFVYTPIILLRNQTLWTETIKLFGCRKLRLY